MNSDTSEFLAGYDEWYKNLPSPGGAADMNKSKGGKMKEWIERHKNCLKLATPNVPYDTPEKSLKLIAEIERQTDIIHFNRMNDNELVKEYQKLEKENKQHQAMREVAEAVDWEGIILLVDEYPVEVVKLRELQHALAAKGKDEKVS